MVLMLSTAFQRKHRTFQYCSFRDYFNILSPKANFSSNFKIMANQ